MNKHRGLVSGDGGRVGDQTGHRHRSAYNTPHPNGTPPANNPNPKVGMIAGVSELSKCPIELDVLLDKLIIMFNK